MNEHGALIQRWPGKSPREPGGQVHPAVFHMLDVAAVAELLLRRSSFAPQLRDALILLTALHDLGKIGAQFRDMLLNGKPQWKTHWHVTESLLRAHDDLIAQRLGGSKRMRFGFYAATAGHHGSPPDAGANDFRHMLRLAGEKALGDAGLLIKAFHQLWPLALLDGIDASEFIALTWWLPGLVSAADWVGSNPEWFQPVPPDLPIAVYWPLAQARAGRAVKEAGLAGCDVADTRLFLFELRPMQKAAQQIALRDGPMLAIIEDETGAGKTEAALLLAQRMMLAGKGRGLFFALPTMATSNAMFSRAKDIVGGMFTSTPSVTLAHGRSAFSDEFHDVIGRAPRHDDDITCAPWLADGRRRALLADVGVGTIDQALLAVLPTKFSTLRLFGLSSKILIVDEVHEVGDPYMAVELAQLLQAHAMQGGSAILLTATLPLDLRQKLVAAFENGAGRDVPLIGDPTYPALTVASGAARHGFAQTGSARGPVAVERLSGVDDAVALLVQRARAGAACVWIRNAVDDAIAAVMALEAAGVEASLLHARFALCDRKAAEEAMLKRFSKNGERGTGQVLVGTQVLESSLDLDFDVMVSDLAPMAALIQRAGRLWRHMDLRPAASRPVPEPILHVVSPDPGQVDDDKWLHRVLDRGAYVYGADLQWRTADHLFRIGKIDAPSCLRGLIEAVHGADAREVPPAIAAAELKRMGEGFAAANLAEHNIVKLADGYRDGGKAFDDTEYPTRLGQEQRVLMLTRIAGANIVPWAGVGAQGEQLSEVQVSARRLRGLEVPLPDQELKNLLALKGEWPDWKRKTVTVVLVQPDGTICPGLRYDANWGLIFEAPHTRG